MEKEKKKIGRPRKERANGIQTIDANKEDETMGIFSIEKMSVGNRALASSLATMWVGSNFSSSRPKGLYATYGTSEAYAVVRDSGTPPDINVGAGVIVLVGLGKDNEYKSDELRIYAVVESKCEFVSFGEVFSGKSSDSTNYDGFYRIKPSDEDISKGRSPITIISCSNYKTSTNREIEISTGVRKIIKGVVTTS